MFEGYVTYGNDDGSSSSLVGPGDGDFVFSRKSFLEHGKLIVSYQGWQRGSWGGTEIWIFPFLEGTKNIHVREPPGVSEM